MTVQHLQYLVFLEPKGGCRQQGHHPQCFHCGHGSLQCQAVLKRGHVDGRRVVDRVTTRADLQVLGHVTVF